MNKTTHFNHVYYVSLCVANVNLELHVILKVTLVPYPRNTDYIYRIKTYN